VTSSIARGLALFLGVFSLVSLAGSGGDANLWWIDFYPLPTLVRVALLIVFAVAMIAYALRPARRLVTIAFLVITVAFALINVIRYYVVLARGEITTVFPIPLSLAIAAVLLFVLIAQSKTDERYPLIVIASFVIASVLFPVAQTVFFGITDYRRPADVIVVFGARAYADGSLSRPLADRVRTGCELYRQGLAPRIIFSGGQGDGAIHETEAMRRAAIAWGVPASVIALDANGVNTESTVRNTAHAGTRILAVSHFYHLPRIKMTYQRYGVDVFTVPAHTTSATAVVYNVARESVAFWAYYLRRLR
jgi:vancomycin permeability regulator SanA